PAVRGTGACVRCECHASAGAGRTGLSVADRPRCAMGGNRGSTGSENSVRRAMIFLHYTGHLLRGEDDPRWQTPRERLEQRVADVLAEHGVSRVYGSLACGADLLVVEQALALGIEVVAFVPYGLERFEELSVRMRSEEHTSELQSREN